MLGFCIGALCHLLLRKHAHDDARKVAIKNLHWIVEHFVGILKRSWWRPPSVNDSMPSGTFPGTSVGVGVNAASTSVFPATATSGVPVAVDMVNIVPSCANEQSRTSWELEATEFSLSSVCLFLSFFSFSLSLSSLFAFLSFCLSLFYLYLYLLSLSLSFVLVVSPFLSSLLFISSASGTKNKNNNKTKQNKKKN